MTPKIPLVMLPLLLLLTGLACANPGAAEEATEQSLLELAEYSKNGVTVVISLELGAQGEGMLAGTFTPDDADAHLYSLELPLEGVDGLGRPTLLELAPGTLMQVIGPLTADKTAGAEEISPDLAVLPVYPAGAVTLRLPVMLPGGGGESFTDQVLVTYMACSPRGCLRPVMMEPIDIQVSLSP